MDIGRIEKVITIEPVETPAEVEAPEKEKVPA